MPANLRALISAILPTTRPNEGAAPADVGTRASGGAVAADGAVQPDDAAQLQDRLAVQERLLAAAPGGWCRVGPDGAVRTGVATRALLNAAPADREGLCRAFEPASADALAAALRRRDASGLELTAATGTRLTVTIDAADGDGWRILWFMDLDEDRILPTTAPDASAPSPGPTTEDGLVAVLDALPQPVWRRDAGCRIVWVNRAYAAAVETSAADAVAEQRDLFPRLGTSLARRALGSGQPQTQRQHVIVHGARRLFQVVETPTGDGVVGHGQDLTEMEDLQAELGRHIAGHAEVLDQLGSAIVIYGPDMRLRFFNQAYLRLSGLDEGWLSGAPHFGDVLEELRQRRRLPEEANFPRYKKDVLGLFTSLLEPREDLMHLPDGTTLRQVVVPHPFGGLMFVQEDVTDRLQLESSYNTLVAVQQETLDNLAEGIAVFGGDGRLRLSNPAWRQLWGMTDDDVAGGVHLSELLDRLRPSFTTETAWTAFSRRILSSALERERIAGRIDRTDGTVVQFATVPLPDGAVITSFLDVTDSVRVELALRQSNAALEAADRLKSEFIANVSYQLRTPLNAIMGFAEILRNQYFGPLNDRQSEYVDGVIESGQRLLFLINDILDLASIEAGFMKLERAPVDVAALLQSVENLSADWARQHGLTLRIAPVDGVGTIDADERRIKQALFNLVSNAIKFTPAGGEIELSAARGPDAVVLTVRDTGIGIPVRDQERAFGRFERAHPEQREPGAGLGLSLVKSFVELHGGRVRMESQPNQGTRIECILPTVAPLAPGPSGEPSGDPPGDPPGELLGS